MCFVRDAVLLRTRSPEFASLPVYFRFHKSAGKYGLSANYGSMVISWIFLSGAGVLLTIYHVVSTIQMCLMVMLHLSL